MKLGFEHAKSIEQFQIMALVVGSIFGGKKKEPPKSFEEAKTGFASVFGKSKKST